MKHAKVQGAWRPVRARHTTRHRPEGVLSALAFNICLVLLPLACAAALIVIGRDHLYAYEYSDAGAQVVRERVEHLNGELIQLDFDRQRQWDDLVSMELRAGDPAAARGFLLSGAGMLPNRSANVLTQAIAADASEAELEVAALELLQPSTRQNYQQQVPLLSQRNAATAAQRPATLADPQDFELMARALIAEPETDPLQFVLTGFALGLAGDLTPGMQQGAVALLVSSRRDDFPDSISVEVRTLAAEALPIEAFRRAARESGAGTVDDLAAAFRSAVVAEHATRLREVLAQLGAVGEATNTGAAATMLTHAFTLPDLQRLVLIARASGDRAAAAAKRLPRDGRLLDTARGELSFTRDLVTALALAGIAGAGLIAIVLLKLLQSATAAWRRMRAEDDEDDYGAELIDISSNNWRPL
ncbi:MAG: hypothetical protein M0D54_07025 [Hyphomonadaceae bacterium JAD_PAG50586_4]|nr:MAG: hypothetical protein M0D54_07025 [Hyphomonadaceae bacterium JAD_PAG50586_4]